MLSFITWTVDPEIFTIGGVTLRWYGLLWVCAIYAAWKIVTKTFKHEYEGYPEEWDYKLFNYGAIGLIVGARLGHCLFYGANDDFFHYYRNPIELIYIWEGGLSSHGGAFGLLIAMYLYNKNVTKKGYLWILDRLVIGVAIGGALIRLGNLMNHEIYGHATDVPWAFRFILNIHSWQNGAAPIFSQPSHPTQIYEMLYCLITFAVLMYLYWKTKVAQKEGLIFGIFLVGIFLTRFFLEFIKENQVEFENTMTLKMGQLLSIPFFLLGFYLIFRNKTAHQSIPNQNNKLKTVPKRKYNPKV